MSWSAYYIGNPEKIAEALKKQSDTLTGPSKDEFDAALPHMIGLVSQNTNATFPPVLRLSASGHGSDGYNYCTFSIEQLSGVLV